MSIDRSGVGDAFGCGSAAASGTESIERALCSDSSSAAIAVKMGEDGFGNQAQLVERALDFVS